MASSDQTRLLLVEDVPQVAQYIRGLLNSQSSVKLLDVLSDGSKVLPQVQQLRPDIVLVDALLQGRVKGLPLAEQIANSGLGISLGDDCVVEAGLYLTAGTVVALPDGGKAKARELSGRDGLLYRRNSVSGAVEAIARTGTWGGLSADLHAGQ